MVRQFHDHALLEFSDIFAENPNDLGHTNLFRHHMDTENAQPTQQQTQYVLPAKRVDTNNLMHNMLQNNIIQPSCRPWASPVVLVQKWYDSLWFCVDYRKLNNVTKKDGYSIPRINDTLDILDSSCWFFTLDLVSGYWEVELAEQNREKTAFCFPESQILSEFKVVSFGLNNVPATFQWFMDLMLSGLFVYFIWMQHTYPCNHSNTNMCTCLLYMHTYILYYIYMPKLCP